MATIDITTVRYYIVVFMCSSDIGNTHIGTEQLRYYDMCSPLSPGYGSESSTYRIYIHHQRCGGFRQRLPSAHLHCQESVTLLVIEAPRN